MDPEREQHGAGVDVTPPSAWDSSTWRGLRAVVREDRETYAGGLMHPAQQMMLVHRFGVWAHNPARNLLIRRLARFIYASANSLYVRGLLGFEVSHLTRIGRRVRFVHQGGVVLQPGAEIGDDCMIYHGVTLGRRWEENHSGEFQAPPRLGQGVHVGVGAVIIGPVRVGDGAKIGPNAVVTTNVPNGASALAPSTRTLRLR